MSRLIENIKVRQDFINRLKKYKKAYLHKKFENLDESATRLMVNTFLTEILGYTELEEVKTEYVIKGTYADYVIQLNRKKYFVVEVKAIQIDISEDHLRQAISYAANEGIDWIVLSNGRQFELYKVLFGKPVTTKQIFSVNLATESDFSRLAESLFLLSKKSVLKNEIGTYWTKFQALEPEKMAKLLYTDDILKVLRKLLKLKTGTIFPVEDIIDSLFRIIVDKVPSTKPKTVKVDANKKNTIKVAKEKEGDKALLIIK